MKTVVTIFALWLLAPLSFAEEKKDGEETPGQSVTAPSSEEKKDEEEKEFIDKKKDEEAYKAKTLPSETYLAAGLGVLAVSFATKCINMPPKISQIPMITFVAAGGIYLYRKVRAKDVLEEKSNRLIEEIREGEKNVEAMEGQMASLRAAASIQDLSSEAADKNASNAKFLQTSLNLSAGLFGVFTSIHCIKENLAAGPFSFGAIAHCILTNNSCHRAPPPDEPGASQETTPAGSGATPQGTTLTPRSLSPPTPLDTVVPRGSSVPSTPTCPAWDMDQVTCGIRNPVPSYPAPLVPTDPPSRSVLDFIVPDKAYAGMKENIKHLKIGAFWGIKYYAAKMASQITRVPDIFKAFMFVGLARVARNAKREWERSSIEFKKRAKAYRDLADDLERQLAATGICDNPPCPPPCDPDDPVCPPCKRTDHPTCRACDPNVDSYCPKPECDPEDPICAHCDRDEYPNCRACNPAVDTHCPGTACNAEDPVCPPCTKEEHPTCRPCDPAVDSYCPGVTCNAEDPVCPPCTEDEYPDCRPCDPAVDSYCPETDCANPPCDSTTCANPPCTGGPYPPTGDPPYTNGTVPPPRTNCATGPVGGTVLDSNCGCARTNSCTRTGLPPFPRNAQTIPTGGFPNVIGRTYRALRQGGDDLYRGNTKGAETAFGLIDRNSAAVNKFRKDAFQRLKRRLKKAKKGNLDNIEKRANRRLSRVATLAYRSMTPGQQAGFSNATGLGSGSNAGFSSSSAPSEGFRGQEVSGVPPSGGVYSAGSHTANPWNSFGDADMGEEDSENPDTMEELEKFEDNESDIWNKSSPSLWRIISARYMKSALPRILKKKKVESSPLTTSP